MKKYFVQVSCLQAQNKMQEKMIAVVQPYQHYLVNSRFDLEKLLESIQERIIEISSAHAKLKPIKVCREETSFRLERDYNAFVTMTITPIKGEY
jgi:ATP-dependent helicase/DNAse subunit B